MKETLTKRFFAPVWKCDKIEAELSRLEREGWRLDQISGLRKFKFTKAPPKNATYFFTYHTRSRNMYDYETFLKKEYKALPIKGNFTEGDTTRIYRIPEDVDLSQHKASRNFFLRYLVLQYVWLGLLFMALSTVGMILSRSVAELILISFHFAVWASIFFPNFLGWIYLRKQYAKYRQTKQE